MYLLKWRRTVLFGNNSSLTSSVQCDQPIHDEHLLPHTHTPSDSLPITYFNDTVAVPRTTTSHNSRTAVAADAMTMQHLMLSYYIIAAVKYS